MLQPHVSPRPSTSPKVNSRADGRWAVPTTVRTSCLASNGTARIELPSLSATKSHRPSEASPLGWANEAAPGCDGRRGAIRPSTMSSFPVARIHANARSIEFHAPNLVPSGHGDVQIAVVDPQVPGAAQGRFQRLLQATERRRVAALVAHAGNRRHALSSQIDLADQMVLGIGHVERFAANAMPWGALNSAAA